VSTVTAMLAPGEDALGLLRGCFPGGSITGAPKIRAMELIEELEGERRSVYCGSIGYLGYGGRFDSNIAIRTMVHAGGELHFWAGGGIVADSVCAEEAAEIEVKARAMRAVAERFGAAPQLRGERMR
jgi:para-aminobenzoate synthetase component 1